MVNDDPVFFAPLAAAAGALVLCFIAERLHARRTERAAALAFGPHRRPAVWAASAPWLRILSTAMAAWGLTTLAFLPPRTYDPGTGKERSAKDPQHVLIVLDVSPSMRLEDAGPERKEPRMARARQLMESFFDRVPLDEFRVSVVAVYNGAKPVVIDTSDFEVIRNIFGDLPMHHAFQAGQTELLEGLKVAAETAKPWLPGSTTVVLVSDGDTVPATGMPKMPPSVRSVVVVGVGDPTVGKFIDGRQSRQDVPALRQIAARLGGAFHNGNEHHLATALIADSLGVEDENPFERLGLREYALITIGLSALVLALLPILLAAFGTRFRPGVRVPVGGATAGIPASRGTSEVDRRSKQGV